jgi:hypothetical protein
MSTKMNHAGESYGRTQARIAPAQSSLKTPMEPHGRTLLFWYICFLDKTVRKITPRELIHYFEHTQE